MVFGLLTSINIYDPVNTHAQTHEYMYITIYISYDVYIHIFMK